MCDTYGTTRAKELARLQQSWRDYAELFEWLRQRWSRRPPPTTPAPEACATTKPQPVTG